MTCAPYISQPAAVIGDEEAIGPAARRLAANGFVPLPVVSGGGLLRGVFGPSQLATLMLPMGARLAGDSFDLGFVSETPDALRERLTDQAEGKVGEHMGEVEPIRADASLDEVLLRMHRGETVLYVVDESGRLTGQVNAAGVLAALVGGA